MKLAKLAKNLIELLQENGLAGQLIYVPKVKSQSILARHLPKVLEEIEATYEKRGVTFYWEASSRKGFSGMFGTNAIASRFRLKPRTATRVSSAAWRSWRDWFGHKERLTLDHLRALAEDCGLEYSSLYQTYRDIRNDLRNDQTKPVDYYAGYHCVPDQFILLVVELAKSSIRSFPWRSS